MYWSVLFHELHLTVPDKLMLDFPLQPSTEVCTGTGGVMLSLISLVNDLLALK